MKKSRNRNTNEIKRSVSNFNSSEEKSQNETNNKNESKRRSKNKNKNLIEGQGGHRKLGIKTKAKITLKMTKRAGRRFMVKQGWK